MRSIWVVVLLMLAGFALSAEERPNLLFREVGKELPGATAVTEEHVANPALTPHRYGPGRDEIKKSHHDQPKRENLNHSSLVYPGKDGKLVYAADERGNRIPDFSHAGYGGGGIAIPDLPVKAEVAPAEGDDGARIQAAIDTVSKLPLDKRSWRGAVLLKKGRYEIAGMIKIAQSGVVLRGEGQDENGTVLVAAGVEKRILIQVGGSGELREVPGTRREITDAYVPVGAYNFHVKDTTGLKAGDSIIAHRPSAAEWIQALGMDRIPAREDGGRIEQWKPGTKDLLFDRVITKINGNQITIDAPICNSLDQLYGGGAIYKYEFPARITQAGVENLRGVSEYKGRQDEDEAHAWDFIVIDAAANAWVRRITALHFAHNAVKVEKKAKWVTVEDSTCLDPVSRIAGSRRYPFTISGQLTLVQRCFARNGRHDFAQGSLSPGPNVFLDCASEKSHSDSGPHHRWASGALYDNVRVPDGAINIRNRGNLGAGHGWAGANMVLCETLTINEERTYKLSNTTVP